MYWLRILVGAMLALPLAAQGCDYPDEGNLPLRRAVTKVKRLPETETWSSERLRQKTVVQYALLLDQPVKVKGRCYWTLEARAEGRTWRRFYVSPDGRSLLAGW